jgi:predicted amidophosphoribosyltransferase
MSRIEKLPEFRVFERQVFMQKTNFLKSGFEHCCNVLFPKICLHCKKEISNSSFFCPSCIEYFEFLPSSFASSFVELKNAKDLNESKKITFIAAFDEMGPCKTLLLEMKREALIGLMKLAASFMVCQYLKLNYPLPDLVVPMFGDESKYLEILAKEVSKLINRPMVKLFYQVKIAFWKNSIFVKKTNLQKKKVLLVVDKVDQNVKDVLELLSKAGFLDITVLGLCK